MKPKKPELQNIIDLKHPLARLAHETDWGFFEAAIEPLYAEQRGGVRAVAGESLLPVLLERLKVCLRMCSATMKRTGTPERRAAARSISGTSFRAPA